MVITIKKDAKPAEIKKQLIKLSGKVPPGKKTGRKKKTLSDYYGSLKNVFGDGLKYQKQVRNEW